MVGSKRISMVIAKTATASRNVVYKATKLEESIFERQSEMLMPEEELGSQSPISYEEDFEDLRSNADLYVFNDQMVQGYRGVNINSRDNEESLGEMHMKDYILMYKPNSLMLIKILVNRAVDTLNQENTTPV